MIICRMTSSSSFMCLSLLTFCSDQLSLLVSHISAVWLVIPSSQMTLSEFTCRWCGRQCCAHQSRLCWRFSWITFFHFLSGNTIRASLLLKCMLFLLSQLPWNHSVFTFCFRMKKIAPTCCCSSTWSWSRCSHRETMVVMYWQQRFWQMTTELDNRRLSDICFSITIFFQNARQRTVNFLLLASAVDSALYAQWAIFHTSHCSVLDCEAVLMGRLCHDVPMLAVSITAGCLMVVYVVSAALVATHAITICQSLHLSENGRNNSVTMVPVCIINVI